jgi:hypothetical protein
MGKIMFIIEAGFTLFIIMCISTILFGSPGAVFDRVFSYLKGGG